LLEGCILWTIWITWNDVVFNHKMWYKCKIKSIIWEGLVEYGKATWLKATKTPTKSDATLSAFPNQFDATWTLNRYLCERIGTSSYGASTVLT
jgi:hypothetical protein